MLELSVALVPLISRRCKSNGCIYRTRATAALTDFIDPEGIGRMLAAIVAEIRAVAASFAMPRWCFAAGESYVGLLYLSVDSVR